MRPPQAAPSLRRRPQGSPSGTGELKGEGLRSCPWDGAILGHTPDAHHNNLLINDLLFPMSPPCDPSTTPGPPPKQTGCSELTAESFVTERKSYNLLLTEPRRVSLRNSACYFLQGLFFFFNPKLLIFLNLFLIGGKLLFNAVSASAIQPRERALSRHVPSLLNLPQSHTSGLPQS